MYCGFPRKFCGCVAILACLLFVVYMPINKNLCPSPKQHNTTHFKVCPFRCSPNCNQKDPPISPVFMVTFHFPLSTAQMTHTRSKQIVSCWTLLWPSPLLIEPLVFRGTHPNAPLTDCQQTICTWFGLLNCIINVSQIPALGYRLFLKFVVTE